MKKIFKILSFVLSVSLLFSSSAFAAETMASKDIPIGSSGQMEMIGTIEPTILSVTMPSFVPFNISNSLSTQNKVISPRINVSNNSNVPIQVDVAYTSVDMTKMRNTTWSDNGEVNDNQIAIGFKQEERLNEMPADLLNTKWLAANKHQNMNVLILDANQQDAMYVVGTIGALVSGSTTFNVTPTLIVRKTSFNN